jgi:glutamyl/glutaminyl-tRNA synthetase
MSKRFAETSLISYRDVGYLPDALMNFLALLGWHPKDDREIFSRDELVAEFDMKRVQKAGAVFNEAKLNWLNREYLKRFSDAELLEKIRPRLKDYGWSIDSLKKAVHLFRDRANTLDDLARNPSSLFEPPEYESKLLIWKNDPLERTKDVLRKLSLLIEKIPNIDHASLSTALEPLATEYGRGSVYWPLRVAVSGLAASPDPIAIADIIGKTETLRRLELAARKLGTA